MSTDPRGYGWPVRRLTASAERVLSGYFGTRVELASARRLTGGTTSVVLRMRVRGGGGELPASVVVKAAAPGFEDPLFNDWAATELLTRLGGDAPVCARCYGGDREVPLIVLEDLGDGVSGACGANHRILPRRRGTRRRGSPEPRNEVMA